MAVFGSATLVLDGPKGSATVEVSATRVTVGRDPKCDCVIADPAVSGSHCELFKDDAGALIIRDLSSVNGTYVNGQRVQRARLYDGDVVHLGQSQGEIRVRQANGRALNPPGALAATLGLTAGGLVLAAAAAGVFWLAHHHQVERDAFVQFENDVERVMQSPSPCDVIRNDIALLGPGKELTMPIVAKPPQIEAAERDAFKALLDKTDARITKVTALVAKLETGPDAVKRQEQLRAALARKDEQLDPLAQLPPWAAVVSRDDPLHDAAGDVKDTLVHQVEDGVNFKRGLAEYVESMNKLLKGLRHITTADGRTSDVDSIPEGDKPAKLLKSCDEAFDNTSREALGRLASVSL